MASFVEEEPSPAARPARSIGLGLLLGLAGFYVESVGSMYWLNGREPAAYMTGGIIAVVGIGVLVAVSVFWPRAGLTGGVTILLVGVVSALLGSRVRLGGSPNFIDIPSLFWHGGYSIIVYMTAVAMVVAAAARSRSRRREG